MRLGTLLKYAFGMKRPYRAHQHQHAPKKVPYRTQMRVVQFRVGERWHPGTAPVRPVRENEGRTRWEAPKVRSTQAAHLGMPLRPQ